MDKLNLSMIMHVERRRAEHRGKRPAVIEFRSQQDAVAFAQRYLRDLPKPKITADNGQWRLVIE